MTSILVYYLVMYKPKSTLEYNKQCVCSVGKYASQWRKLWRRHGIVYNALECAINFITWSVISLYRLNSFSLLYEKVEIFFFSSIGINILLVQPDIARAPEELPWFLTRDPRPLKSWRLFAILSLIGLTLSYLADEFLSSMSHISHAEICCTTSLLPPLVWAAISSIPLQWLP